MNDEWQTIYEEYVGDIRRFLIFFMRNADEADDLTQETFIRAFRNWDKFDRRSSVKTWMLSIARNLAVDRARKEQRKQLLQRLLRAETIEPPALPDVLLHVSERKQALYAAIQSLPLQHRTVVILRGIQEYAPTEVADILGWSVNKVNVTYHRALKSLRNLVKGEELFHELVSR